jgi:hypothetical protein
MFNKKYIPFIALVASALFLYYVKTKQRGVRQKQPKQVTVQPGNQTNNNTTVTNNIVATLNRSYTKLTFTRHARCRMGCRNIDEAEVKEIIATGVINQRKVEQDSRGATYPLEGKTSDNQNVRIVVAPKNDGELVVVTCIDLDTDWKCNCQ